MFVVPDGRTDLHMMGTGQRDNGVKQAVYLYASAAETPVTKYSGPHRKKNAEYVVQDFLFEHSDHT